MMYSHTVTYSVTATIASPEMQNKEVIWMRLLLHGTADDVKPCGIRRNLNDVGNEEQRKYCEDNYCAPADMRYYRENDRWLFPVAMRAVSSLNLDSRHTDKNENDVVLDPRLTSLGGNFHITTLGKISSNMKFGILPGGDKGTRRNSFFNGTGERPYY